MKPFRFSLHALLTLRQRQEQLALQHYSAALRDRRRALEATARADHDLARAWTDLRLQMEGCCSAGQVACHRAQCAAIEERRNRAREEARQAEEQVREKLTVLTEARRDRRVVDRLRERRRDEFDRELNRQEGRFLDELAQRRPTTVQDWLSRS